MTLLTVGMGDLQVSSDPDIVLVTYALGSCIGLVLHDPARRLGGMLHYMLPQSAISHDKAAKNPAMFGDTGIPKLFERMYALGAKKPDLVVKVAGGGRILDAEGVLDIGSRNYTLLRKLFWKNGVIITAEDVGGSLSRTVRLHVGSGRVTICSQGKEREL